MNQFVMKKLMALLLTTILLIPNTLTDVSVAAYSVWDSSAVVWTTGDGTKDSAYEISTGSQLAYLTQQTNAGENYSGKYFKMTDDINLNSINWTPINDFAGIFNGNGHKITGLKISSADTQNVGFFGSVGAGGMIENLGLVGVSISSSYPTSETKTGTTGGLAGKIIGGTIINCYVTGSVKGLTDYQEVGGIVGHSEQTTIANFYNMADVTGAGNSSIGGIVGNCKSGYLINGYDVGIVTGGVDSKVGTQLGTCSGHTINVYSTQEQGISYVGDSRQGSSYASGLDMPIDQMKGTASELWTLTCTTNHGLVELKGFVAALNTGRSAISVADVTPTAWVADTTNTNNGFPKLDMGNGSDAPWIGDGTKDSAYEISTGSQLAYLTQQTNAGENYSGKYFKMTDDINLNSINWTPINDFAGIFNGNGHKITDLKISSADIQNVGFFGSVETGGMIENLGLVGVSISSSYPASETKTGTTGGLVGKIVGGTIINCYVTGSVKGLADYQEVGGIAGYSEQTTIANFYNMADVTGAGNSSIGGIVGNCKSGYLINGYDVGIVTGGVDSKVGTQLGTCSGHTINVYSTKEQAISYVGDPKLGSSYTSGTDMSIDQMKGKSTSPFLSSYTSSHGLAVTSDFIIALNGGKGVISVANATPAAWVADITNTNNGLPKLNMGIEPYSPWTGNGAKENPYIISTGTQLAYLAEQTYAGIDYSGKYFKMTDDINLNSIYWTPINNFSGIFNGDGHKITGLMIADSYTQNVGFFGSVKAGGTIENLGLVGVSIVSGYSGSQTETGMIGGLVGRIIGGTIINCYVTGSVKGLSGYQEVGGIAGYSEQTTIANFYNMANVAGAENSSIGGVIGNCKSGDLLNGYDVGIVTGGTTSAVGSQIGTCYGSLNNSYSTTEQKISFIGDAKVGSSYGAMYLPVDQMKGKSTSPFLFSYHISHGSAETSDFIIALNGGKSIISVTDAALATWVVDTTNTNNGFPKLEIDATPKPMATVTSVKVTPDNVSLKNGMSYTFSAAVVGTNNPSQSVIWTVTGNNSSGTVIKSGLLTVAADETASSFTVEATSTIDASKYSAAIVTVKNSSSGRDNSSSSSSRNTIPDSSNTVTTNTTPTGGTVTTITPVVDATPVIIGNRANVSVTVPSEVSVAIASATAEKPAEVKITVPTSSVVAQINDATVQTVDLTVRVPTVVANNTNANAIVDINLEQAVLQAAKDAKKDVTVTVANSETDSVAYSVTFKGADLAASTTAAKDVNLAVSIKLTTTVSAVNAVTQSNKGIVLKFANNGVLPSVATVKVNVATYGYRAGQTLYFYYFNPTTNALETAGTTAYTVDAGGYANVIISHCSDYALLPSVARSITLDTTSYTMAPKKSYQIGVKSIGTGGTTLKVYSSSSDVATVTTLKNGNYQVTSKGVGTAYIMFDVYDKKNKCLTHASVRINVAKGTKPFGVSARQIGVF